MQGEHEKARDQTDGSGQQQPVGQNSANNEYGEGTGNDQSKTEDQGFILQQGGGPNDELQERGSDARAIEGNDFAPEGRGALEGEQEDVEGGHDRASRSDIEQQ